MSENRSHLHPTRKLPPQPSLEQLRKQAKELLQGYRAGETAACKEIGEYERAPNDETFALNDAQRVLARAYGFASWPKLKAFVDGVNVRALASAVQNGDIAQVRRLLSEQPELVGKDMAENDEHQALHYAVLRRNAEMVRLLMEAGADARKGIYPHRDATSALTIARDREYEEIVAIIEEEERLRREEMSCPNATVSPVQDEVNRAIRGGDNTTAIRLLKADGSVIQACDRSGGTPLHTAAEAGNPEMTAWLLERRADVRKLDVRGLTPLDRAALAVDPRDDGAEHFPEVARLLMGRGAEVTIRAAVALGDAARVRELVVASPSLLREITSNGGLLTLAVNHAQAGIVELLLDLGADVDERVMLEQLEEPMLSWGMPLWYAALAGNREIAQLLLDRGADPNANVYASGWPLRNAWSHEDDAVKRLLLERGAKLQPYMVAESHDVAEAARMLAADGSEQLAQELTWSSAEFGCPEILALALPRLGWAPDDARWHWILIQPIRGAGSDDAANEGHYACMDMLLRYGVSPNVTRSGHTALHFTAARHSGLSDAGRARFAAMLVDAGARMDVRDDLLQSTALGWACRWGWKAMAQVLIARGAAVEEPDAEPWATPRAWANKMGHGGMLDG